MRVISRTACIFSCFICSETRPAITIVANVPTKKPARTVQTSTAAVLSYLQIVYKDICMCVCVCVCLVPLGHTHTLPPSDMCYLSLSSSTLCECVCVCVCVYVGLYLLRLAYRRRPRRPGAERHRRSSPLASSRSPRQSQSESRSTTPRSASHQRRALTSPRAPPSL